MRPRSLRTPGLIGFALAVLGGCLTAFGAEETAIGLHAQSPAANQLWLVGTRKLPHGTAFSSRRMRPDVECWQSGDAWQSSSLDDLIASHDPRLTTIVFVHGNDTDDEMARSKGLGIYQSLVKRAAQPFRLIIWSWPADYVVGTLRRDARLKADVADADAWYLACFVDELDRDESLSLVGYSFGARLIGGALQLLGGGSLGSTNFDAIDHDARAPIRAVLLAAALDDDWLLPGRRYGQALSVVDRLVVLVNPQDRVLRWYRFLSPGAKALGSRGLASLDELGTNRMKVEQVDVASFVGVQHRWSTYLASDEILQQLTRETVVGAHRRSGGLVK